MLTIDILVVVVVIVIVVSSSPKHSFRLARSTAAAGYPAPPASSS